MWLRRWWNLIRVELNSKVSELGNAKQYRLFFMLPKFRWFHSKFNDLYLFFSPRHLSSVGIQSNPSLTWGGRYKHLDTIAQYIDNADNALQHNGSCYVNISEALVDTAPSAQFLVRAHVVDFDGCTGKDSNFTYGKLRCFQSAYLLRVVRPEEIGYVYL